MKKENSRQNPYLASSMGCIKLDILSNKSSALKVVHRADFVQEKKAANCIDYGARYYDPSLSIWLGVDPLADQFPGWNPYHYVHNNPINLIDPTGMSAEDPTDPPNQLPTVTITAQRGPSIARDNTIAPLALPSRVNDIRGENADDYWKVKGGRTGTQYLTNNEMYSSVSGSNSQVEFNMLRGQYGMEHAHGVFQHGIKQAISDGYDLMSIPVYAVVPLPAIGGIFRGYNLNYGFFGFKDGYGLLAKRGMNGYGVGGINAGRGYKLDLMYANPRAGKGAGTLFSLQQSGAGANKFRLDYGPLHKQKGKMALHFQFRYTTRSGVQYGSSKAQYSFPFFNKY